jgi:uncharacterized protein YbjT (DUF2867 family)
MLCLNSFSKSSNLQSFSDVSLPATRVLLLGATGFIGSYVLRQLQAQGVQVVAVSRQTSEAQTNSPGLRWLALPLQTMLSDTDWLHHVRQVDVVINCVGILRQRLGGTYNAIHHKMPAALAKACWQSGVRLIHTSALGLHESAKAAFYRASCAVSKRLRPAAATIASYARV